MLHPRISLPGLVAVLAAGLLVILYQAGTVPGKEPGSAKVAKLDRARDADDDNKAAGAGSNADLNQLSLQVAALKMLSSLDATPAQLAKIAEVAGSEGLGKTKSRKAAKATAKFRRTLLLLRDALVENDGDGVKYFSDKVDGLRDGDDVDLDDAVETTQAARAKVPEVLRQLTPRQVTAYLNAYDESLPDPARRIFKTLEDGQMANGKDWQDQRDDAAADVGWLVAGFNMKNVAQVTDNARKLLDEAHRLKGEDLTKQKPELEEKIRETILGKVTAVSVLFHIMEHDLAELLSNPQLPAALQARSAATKSP